MIWSFGELEIPGNHARNVRIFIYCRALPKQMILERNQHRVIRYSSHAWWALYWILRWELRADFHQGKDRSKILHNPLKLTGGSYLLIFSKKNTRIFPLLYISYSLFMSYFVFMKKSLLIEASRIKGLWLKRISVVVPSLQDFVTYSTRNKKKRSVY